MVLAFCTTLRQMPLLDVLGRLPDRHWICLNLNLMNFLITTLQHTKWWAIPVTYIIKAGVSNCVGLSLNFQLSEANVEEHEAFRDFVESKMFTKLKVFQLPAWGSGMKHGLSSFLHEEVECNMDYPCVVSSLALLASQFTVMAGHDHHPDTYSMD